MAVTPVASFIRLGNTWFNASEIKQISLVGDNTGNAHVIYGGGNDYLKLNFGASDSAATTAINTLLGGPADATSNLIGYVQ
jgi:hypothetical protein